MSILLVSRVAVRRTILLLHFVRSIPLNAIRAATSATAPQGSDESALRSSRATAAAAYPASEAFASAASVAERSLRSATRLGIDVRPAITRHLSRNGALSVPRTLCRRPRLLVQALLLNFAYRTRRKASLALRNARAARASVAASLVLLFCWREGCQKLIFALAARHATRCVRRRPLSCRRCWLWGSRSRSQKTPQRRTAGGSSRQAA